MAKPATIAAVAAGILCCVGTGQALAQTCDAQIARLEARYGLRDAPLPASPAGPSATVETQHLTDAERHAQSGGVLTPPDIGAPVATAPMSGSSLPPAAVAAPPDRYADTLGPAERQRMTGLMDAARAASRRGDMAQCLDRLREAEAVPGVSGARRPE